MASPLKMKNVRKTYRKGERSVAALDGVTLGVGRGELVIVRGPSGSGKTTLLLTAGGLLEPDTGEVAVAGRYPCTLLPEERARLRAAEIGFVFQQFHLLPYLTVFDNVMIPSLALPREGSRERARELIEDFGLLGRADHLPGELSTGERQRTALARAMLNEPGLLLVDEPTGNLDPDNAALVMERLAAYAANGGAVLVVTHSEAAEKYASRIDRLIAGRLSDLEE